MPLQPGFVDAPLPAPDPEAPNRPSLLDADKDADRGPIDHLWEPERFGKRTESCNSSVLFATGFALLIGGWLILSAVGFAADQFHRSLGLGALTLIVFGMALALISFGTWIEVKAYRALWKVEALRNAFARPDITAAEAKVLCKPWARARAAQLADADVVLDALVRAETVAEIKSVLQNRVLEPLRQIARQAGRRAAVQGGAVVAITPSSALDGVLAGLRALALIRQVARIYGLRPGPAVTVALLHRVAWTVAGVSGIELLSRSLADHTLERLPLIKHLAGAVPGTSLTAIRLYRLADVTAEACSPLSD